MGTNYYFRVKGFNINDNLTYKMDRKLYSSIADKLSDCLNEVCEIHIGKRSCGWKPSFQKTEHYSTVQEIRNFYNDNIECLEIFNEYDESLTFEQLEEELINWNKDVKNVRSHGCFDGNYSDSEGYEFSEYEFS